MIIKFFLFCFKKKRAYFPILSFTDKKHCF
jgi:hypothetical protein